MVKLVARLADLQCFGESALEPKAGEVQAEWQQVVDVVAEADNSKSDVEMGLEVGDVRGGVLRHETGRAAADGLLHARTLLRI